VTLISSSLNFSPHYVLGTKMFLKYFFVKEVLKKLA
jgi:hypothetical protein